MNLVEMVDIHKAFGAVHALDGANLTIGTNEIVGLVGDNAAGKSTLMKVLSGAYRKDSGTILIRGIRREIHSPEDARKFGIEMVYQDLALADNLDVTANIFMGREVSKGFFLHNDLMVSEARFFIDRLGINIADVGQSVQTLSGGQRQSIALARAMAFNASLVIMDEPTANLSPAAAERILDIIHQLKVQGMSVIHISHRMDEVRRVSDRIVVMSHGKMVDA